MNLKSMVDKVAFALNYNPETQVYEDEIVRVLNDRYLEISSREDWLFLQSKEDLDIKATITGTSSTTITGVTDAYQVEFDAGTLSGYTASDLDGQTLVVGSSEFTIAYKIDNATLAVTSDASGITTPTSSWTIEFRTYPYPKRAEEVLDIISRDDDRGKLRYADWKREVSTFLDRDQTGDPTIYIEDEHAYIYPPEEPPAAADSAGSGSLIDGNIYEYCYTFLHEGLESPPSVTVSETATSTGIITVSSLPDTADESGYETFKRKRIYRRNVTDGGRWQQVTTVAGSVTSYPDDGSTFAVVEADFLFEPGPRPRFRCWSTADSDITVEVRFKRHPRRMQADADVPEWPTPYHDIIVHAALSDLCLTHGMPQQAQLYYARAERKIEQMSGRYLTRKDARYVRRGFGRSLSHLRYGDPIKN